MPEVNVMLRKILPVLLTAVQLLSAVSCTSKSKAENTYKTASADEDPAISEIAATAGKMTPIFTDFQLTLQKSAGQVHSKQQQSSRIQTDFLQLILNMKELSAQ